jgi:RNA polymerase sigma-70 factor (ECF subfamily)
MDDATPNSPRDDATLLALIAAGDESAMIEFYDRWFPQLRRLATYRTRNPQDGEDIALEILLRVLQTPTTFNPHAGSVRSWLLTTVRNRAIDLGRRKKVRKALSLGDPDDGPQAFDVPDREPTAEERAWARERAELIRTALGKLSEEDQEILLLRDYEGRKAPEVATLLGISVEKVGSRLYRARRRFEALLRTDWPDLFPREE